MKAGGSPVCDAVRRVRQPRTCRRTHERGTIAKVPARKRRVTYPKPRNATTPQRPGAGPEPSYVRPNIVAIDRAAAIGRTDLTVGDRVRIVGSGLYSGEAAVIERFTGGVIPSALVRTEAGNARQVRTIDLEPLTEGG